MTPRDRVLTLLERHGRYTTSFQVLEPGISYWFADNGDACVAYFDTGAAWVAVGGPIAAPERENRIAGQFIAAARQARRRVSFFAIQKDDLAAANLSYLHIGEQPSWAGLQKCGVPRAELHCVLDFYIDGDRFGLNRRVSKRDSLDCGRTSWQRR